MFGRAAHANPSVILRDVVGVTVGGSASVIPEADATTDTYR
jgi:hypothetical protein